jgi:two-component system response regulator ChvI
MTYGVERPGRASRGVSRRNAAANLVFIDADDIYRDIVKSELMEAGFSVLDFPSGEAAAASLLSGTEADLIIIDWGAEKSNGSGFLKAIRDAGIDVPVVALMERSSAVHERFAFRQGAADFIDKSRGTDIVAARVRLILTSNRRSPAPANKVEYGRLLLEGSRAYWDGIDVHLTAGEFKIVLLLATGSGQHASFRQIYDALHYAGFVAGAGEQGYRGNVRAAIKRIRRKFQVVDPGWEEITNSPGLGYSLRKKTG